MIFCIVSAVQVMDTLSANSKLTLAPVLTLTDGRMVAVTGGSQHEPRDTFVASAPHSGSEKPLRMESQLHRQASAPIVMSRSAGSKGRVVGSSHSVTFADEGGSLHSPSVGSLSSLSHVSESRCVNEDDNPNASWAMQGLVPVYGGGHRSLPEPERSIYYKGGRNLVPLPVTQGKRYRKVVDPDTLSTENWDQRFLDRFNADPAKYVYSNTPSDQILVGSLQDLSRFCSCSPWTGLLFAGIAETKGGSCR
jgi:hypothetical protein